jgi:phenylacetate-CoA ligase
LDALSKNTKDKMEYYFKITTLSRWSNMEAGMIVQQDYNGGHEFNLNWASLYIELLDLEEDKPVNDVKIE